MNRSSGKSGKKDDKSRSSKVSREETVDGHDGGFDPTEEIVGSSSSGPHSGGKGDSYRSNAARNKDKSTSGTKARELDPTGHEGSYDPSTD